MRFVRRHILTVAAFIVLVYLFIPIAVVGALSFNDPPSKYNTKWYGFSLDAWTNMCGIPGVCESFIESIKIGHLHIRGHGLGNDGRVRARALSLRGRKTTNLLIFLPMATPEVVMGSSLLALFLNMTFPLGSTTVIIAHIMFTISFVVVAVKARLQGLIRA